MALQPQRQNYQKMLDRMIEELEHQGRCPRLFLHSCCAPCSSYVLEYLSKYFEITVFYYNPNIDREEEYCHRAVEQRRLIHEMGQKGVFAHPVSFLEGDFIPEDYYGAVRGHEQDREGGERCTLCYELRLREAARRAAMGRFDYFTTTLSISPLKNAQKLNEIGGKLAKEYGIPYLFSDFKKKDGYKRSIELSAIYGLYRQDYCGCVFSKRERSQIQAQRVSEGAQREGERGTMNKRSG